MPDRTNHVNNTVIELPDGTTYNRADVAALAARLAELETVATGGTTAERPASPLTYQSYFDTTLGKPVWYDGSGWVDATGTTA